jgi:hypothetical protein
MDQRDADWWEERTKNKKQINVLRRVERDAKKELLNMFHYLAVICLFFCCLWNVAK